MIGSLAHRWYSESRTNPARVDYPWQDPWHSLGLRLASGPTHGPNKKATKGRQKGKDIPPRVSQGWTARAQTAPQIQARRASLQARKTAHSQGQVLSENPSCIDSPVETSYSRFLLLFFSSLYSRLLRVFLPCYTRGARHRVDVARAA